MDSEFYFEESNPRKSKIIFVVIILLISLMCIGFVFLRNKYTLSIKKNLEFEIGTKLDINVSNFITNEILDENDYSIYYSSFPLDEEGMLNKVGEYSFEIKYKNISKKGKIKVVDTTAPEVEVTDLLIGTEEELVVDDFVSVCKDYSMPCIVKFKDEDDQNINKKAGKYSIDIIISDQVGNKVTKSVNLEARNGYSSIENKTMDLRIDHIEPNYSDWKQEMVIKYSHGYDPNDIEETDAYTELMELTASDYHEYIDPIYANNLIVDSELIEVYNRYNLIIGYGVKIKLDNGLSFYLSK